MATAAAKLTLRPIEISPTTLQYAVSRPNAKTRPAYPKRFYPNEDALRTINAPWLKYTDPTMPPYPYGKETHFTEANQGLYGGKKIQSGSKISSGRNKGHTMRKWYPNVRVEKLRSEALDVEMNLPVVARVKRTITKCGGLDEYLLGEKPARLKELGLMGWKLRWMVLKSQVVKERWARQREELGLTTRGEQPKPSTIDETFADAWQDPNVRKQLIEKMSIGWEQLKDKETKFMKHARTVMKDDFDAEDEKDEPAMTRRGIEDLELFDPRKVVFPDQVEEQISRYKAPAIVQPKINLDRLDEPEHIPAPAMTADDLKHLAERVAEQQSTQGTQSKSGTETEIAEVVEAEAETREVEDDQDISRNK